MFTNFAKQIKKSVNESYTQIKHTRGVARPLFFMKPQSCKAKGRNLQKWVREQLIEQLDIHPEDIESRSMGAGGEDLIMARAARQKFPFSVECKNVEKLNVWEAYEQAKANCGSYEPIVVMKKNHKKPLVVIDAESFINLMSKISNDHS